MGYTLHVYPERVIDLFVFQIIERFTRSQHTEAYKEIYLLLALLNIFFFILPSGLRTYIRLLFNCCLQNKIYFYLI